MSTLSMSASPSYRGGQFVDEEPTSNRWMAFLVCSSTCIVPCVLVVLFWANKVQCGQVVKYAAISCLTGLVLACIFSWWLRKQEREWQSKQLGGIMT